MIYFSNFHSILPEFILFISGMLLLMYGAFVKNKNPSNLNILTLLTIFIASISLLFVPDKSSIASSTFINSLLTKYIKLFILILAFLVIYISSNYLKKNQIYFFEYPVLLIFSILGMLVMISANDLIILYISIELQSLSLYVLVALRRGSIKGSEAALKYFILGSIASAVILYGCSMVYSVVGATNYEIIKQFSNQSFDNLILSLGLVLIISGVAFKLSAAPFHMWTPDVYEGAPTSITSFFAVVPKVAGLALLIKFMFIPFSNILLEWQTIIIFISIASMILGAVAAMIQTNFKRLLAYSSIGHIGYALAGVATGTISGYQSAIVYISIYVIMNIGAFSCLYLLKKDNQYKENINDLSGISKKHPLLAISLLIILFSLAGVPPLGGFFAKFYVFVAVLEKEMYALAIIGLLTTVMSAFYYLKIIKTIYFDDSLVTFELSKNRTAQVSVFASCIILTTFFLYPSVLNDIVSTLFVS